MIASIVANTALLMNAMQPFSIVEDQSNLPLLNPELNQRQTLKLRLNNGMCVLLISDKGADQSAASLCVEVGSWSDPLEYAGMAHFCEHMLFMGTQKYPNVNEFSTFISDYAGQMNAFTAPNRTVYMFSAQTSGFLSILDRFAHFFIDPLFNPSYLSREMHNVDQEFAKNIEHDGWREYMVFKETGNPKHPNRLFSTGNSQTLGKIPQEALKNWHQSHYGAEKMHLVLYSPLPMDELKENVVQMFSQVPKSGGGTVDTSGSLTSKNQVGHMIAIKPIQNRKSLTLSWELPLALAKDPSQSAQLFAYALRRGQKYSLYEKLKNDGLIDTMSTRVDEMGGNEHRFFQISLELTEKGLAKMETAILHCFEAIATLRDQGIPAYVFEEKNEMAKLNYQYQARQNPFDYIMHLGDTILEEDLSTYPRHSILAAQYDAEKIALFAKGLTPKMALFSVMSPPELIKTVLNRKEKWLGTEYAICKIPQDWMERWEKAESNSSIRVPGPNPFLPKNLTFVQGAQGAQGEGAVPIPIAESDLGVAYYVRSPEFGTPEVVYHIHILSPEINPSARSAVLSSIYLDHLTDIIHPMLAAAKAAGLSCNFEIERSRLHLELSGYSEKAPLFLQEILRQMPLDPPTPDQFAIYMARHEKGYLNGQKELAVRQAKDLLDSIVNRDKVTKKEKLLALQSISYEEFLKFHEALFETTYAQGLFCGNLTLKQAEVAWLDVIHGLCKAPYPKERHFETKVLRFNEASGPYQIAEKTDVQGNAALLLVDEGDFTFEKRSVQEVLASILQEAFFNELRTKQKTGYIAQSAPLEIEERLFQYFVVQSNSHQPEELVWRFEQFIEEFSHSIAENVSLERFETIKASLVSSLKMRFRNLGSKSLLWDRLAFERDADFAFLEKRIDGLSALSYDEFLRSSKAFLGRDNKKRLAILYTGKLQAPFTYNLIGSSQIESIATYIPRERAPDKSILLQTGVR